MDEVGGLGGDEDEAAVAGDLDALGLLAGLVEADLLAGLDVVDGGRRILLVRDVEVAAIGVQVEGLGLGHVADALHQLAAGHLVDGDHRVVGAADIELRAVGAELHAARPRAGLDRLYHLMVRVEHADGVRALIRDEDQAGAGGPGVTGPNRGGAEDRGEQSPEKHPARPSRWRSSPKQGHGNARDCQSSQGRIARQQKPENL